MAKRQTTGHIFKFKGSITKEACGFKVLSFQWQPPSGASAQ